MRDIHWKLSARMDQLMSRRYAAEKKKLVDFFLDLSSDAKEDIYRMDAFWNWRRLFPENWCAGNDTPRLVEGGGYRKYGQPGCGASR